jgi:hypothetical protein
LGLTAWDDKKAQVTAPFFIFAKPLIPIFTRNITNT